MEQTSDLEEFWQKACLQTRGLERIRRLVGEGGTWEWSAIPPERSVGRLDHASMESPSPDILLLDQVTLRETDDRVSIVVLTLERNGDVEITEFGCWWPSPSMPESYRRANGAVIVGAGGDVESRTEEVVNALADLRRRRKRKFQRCVRCEVRKPPEWWHGDGHCQSCAERYLGVVH